MESGAYEGGGAGGKVRRSPMRRAAAPTPYDRPPTAGRGGHGGIRNGWLLRLVDPALRIITGGTSRLFSFVFRKPFPSLPAPPPPSDENLQLIDEDPRDVCLKSLSEVQEKGKRDGKEIISNSESDGISELEQLMKQKTFTRAEFNYLTELLRRRTIESMRTEPMDDNMEFSNAEKDKGTGQTFFDRNTTPSNGGLSVPKEEASPAEIAKEYMGSRPSKLPSLRHSTQSLVSREDATLPNGVPFAVKPPDLSVAPRSIVPFHRVSKQPENGYFTPRSRGRSALYRMCRSPYFNVQTAANAKGGMPVSESSIQRHLKINMPRHGSGHSVDAEHDDTRSSYDGVPPIPHQSSEMSRKILQQLDNDDFAITSAPGSAANGKDKQDSNSHSISVISETQISEKLVASTPQNMHLTSTKLSGEFDGKSSDRPAPFSFPLTSVSSTIVEPPTPTMPAPKPEVLALAKAEILAAAFNPGSKDAPTTVFSLNNSDPAGFKSDKDHVSEPELSIRNTSPLAQAEGLNLDRGDKNQKASKAFKSFGGSVSSDLPTSPAASTFALGASVPSLNNGSLNPNPPAMFGSGNPNSGANINSAPMNPSSAFSSTGTVAAPSLFTSTVSGTAAQAGSSLFSSSGSSSSTSMSSVVPSTTVGSHSASSTSSFATSASGLFGLASQSSSASLNTAFGSSSSLSAGLTFGMPAPASGGSTSTFSFCSSVFSFNSAGASIHDCFCTAFIWCITCGQFWLRLPAK